MADLLEFKNLTKVINPHHSLRVSGRVQEGKILMVRGPSGSGKSTFLRLLARLIPPDGGKVFFQGQDWMQIPAPKWRIMVHYVPQKPVIFAGTGADNLHIPFALKTVREKKSLDYNKLEHYCEALSISSETIAREAQTLSGGEGSRLAVIRALLLEPRILMLDEPTAHLDSRTKKKVLQVLVEWLETEPGRGAILVSHSEEDIEDIPAFTVLEILSGDEG